MSESRQFRYARDVSSSAFSKALSHRVDEYFQRRGISRHANPEMVAKTILGVVWWIGTYYWLMTGRFSALQVVGVYVLQGLAQLYMSFNVAHDANHGAYSKSRTVNRAIGYVFDLVGASSYMWRLLHNDAHHSFVNIEGADTTLLSGKLFRFSPHDERKPFHRYQHLYAPFLYLLCSLDWVLFKDYRWLLYDARFGNHRITRHPAGQLAALFFFKALYYTYMLVLPLIYLSVAWYSIVLGFVTMHCVTGFIMAVIFQPNHFNEHATYPRPDEEGHISNDYIRHIFDTTSDYASANHFANWILGGLNLHVIHHMFPRVCHVHYPALTKIVKTTAEEHGLPYRETRTITGAFLAHLRWMKVLGSADTV
jgi:linoleoyl-CoA desaturase